MKTFNELRAIKVIAQINKDIESDYSQLLELMEVAKNSEMPAVKVRREYRRLISAAAIDCKRAYGVANQYFNHSGKVPATVEDLTIYNFNNRFAPMVTFFEL